jgi:hypothetical protein
MEAHPLLPSQFYSEINQFIDDRETLKDADLDHIYALIQHCFPQGDSFDIQPLSQIRVKLQKAQVDENHKIMRLLQQVLEIPQSQTASDSQERQAIDWATVLPKEIWKEIFAYLGKDFSKMMRLSRGFHTLFKEPSIQALIIERYASKLTAEQLIAHSHSQSCGSLVKKLDLSHLKDLTDSQLASLIQAYPNLRALHLSECKKITDKGIQFVTQLPQLRTLKLNISESSTITNKGLTFLAQLTELETLHLSSCKIADQELLLLAKLTRLQTLNLSSCWRITNQGLITLSQLTQLRTLNLSGCANLTDQGLISLEELKNLQILCLSGCFHITDQGLTSLAKLTQLQTLDLSLCDQITNQGTTLLAKLERLKIVNLAGCFKIRNEG